MRTGVTAAVGVLSLALITGCGGGSDDDSKASESPRPSEASASPTTAAAKALGAAELEKLLLVQSDLPRDKIADGDDTLPKSRSELKTDKAACAPLAYALTGLPRATPTRARATPSHRRSASETPSTSP